MCEVRNKVMRLWGKQVVRRGCWWRAVLSILTLSLAGCTTAAVATPEPVLITIGGGSSMQPVLRALTAEYNRQHPNILFTLRGGGSALGEEQAQSRRIDLGASTLFPPDDADAGASGLTRIPIGVDGLAIIVHSSNPVTSLTIEELQGLYTGTILKWEEVGGGADSVDGGEVVLVSREDGSGARRLFEDQVMDDQSVSLTAVVMPSSADMMDYIAKTPNAIGYVSRGWVMGPIEFASQSAVQSTRPAPGTATDAVRSEDLDSIDRSERENIRVVAVEDTLPNLVNLSSQEYALIQPLYLISRGEVRGRARQFVDFVLSPAGQAVVARYHLPVR